MPPSPSPSDYRKVIRSFGSWRGSSNKSAGHGLVFALLPSSSSPLLSQDIKADLLQLIYKGPGWASATERNNYSQLLPICPTVNSSTSAADANAPIWKRHIALTITLTFHIYTSERPPHPHPDGVQQSSGGAIKFPQDPQDHCFIIFNIIVSILTVIS